MGTFDDLIPQQSGAFDDLIPQAPSSQPPRERGYGEQLWRDTQLAGRALVKPFGGEGLADLLHMARPEDENERMREAIAGAVFGNMGVMKGAQLLSQGASGATQGILKLLAANPRAQSVLAGIGGGAGQAVAESGGGELEQTAAAFGAPVAAAMAGKVLSPAVRTGVNIIDSLTAKGAERAAGRIAADVAGDKGGAVVAAIRAGAPIETAAQAAVPVGRAEFSGLEALAKSRLPSEYGPTGAIPTKAANWLTQQRGALNQATDPIRTQILSQADETGLNVSPLSMEIARLRAMPGFKDKTSTHILNWLDKELIRRADAGTGDIAGVDLYGLRKDLGTEIKKRAADKAKPWDKQMGAKLLGEMQRNIDFEIERAAGNDAWTSQYLQPYAARAKELGAIPQRALDSQTMGQVGVDQARKISRVDETPVTLPNLLSRPMMIVNAALRATQGKGGERTTATLADLMRPENKGRLADLMEAELMRRKARIPALDTAIRAGMVGAEVGAMQ